MQLKHFLTHPFQKLFSVMILIVGLSSCIPAALLIGATVGGAVVYDKRTMSTMAQDQEAAEQARRAIQHTPELKKGAHISISTFNHILL